MVRHYSSRPLAPEVIERVLANALRAPSAGLAQGWALLAITDPADRARFWPFVPDRVKGTPTMQNAPLVVVALSHKDTYFDHYAKPGAPWPDRSESHWAAPYWDIDTGMAALLMLLTAVDEGLGACFFGVMPEDIDPFRAEFGVPDDYHAIGAVTVAYRADDLPAQSTRIKAIRRNAEEAVHRGQRRQHH